MWTPILSACLASLWIFVMSPMAAQEHKPAEFAADSILNDYEATGETRNCIDLSELRLNRRHILNDRMVLFEGDRNHAFLNRLDGKCPFLKAYGQFQLGTSSSRLCNTDTVTVLQRQAGAGTQCGLGTFEILKRKD